MSPSIAGSAEASNASLLNMETRERAAAYLADLSRKRKIFTEIICEEPQTPPRSPLDKGDDAYEERINALREHLREAYAIVDGNPADGKWVFLSRLLRMGVTSGHGGRWAGARTDVQPADELKGKELHWINADTESEWKEWELRDQEERILRDKVESWKRRLVTPQTSSTNVIPPSGKISVASSTVLQNIPEQLATSQSKPTTTGTGISKAKIANARAASSTPFARNPAIRVAPSSLDPLKDHSPFGFSVVKRASQQSSAGKPAGSAKHKQPNKRPEPKRGSSFLVPRPDDPIGSGNKPNEPPTSIRGTNIYQIADGAGSSFIYPSFSSSAIVTSTPKLDNTAKSRRLNSLPHATPPPFQSQPAIPSPPSPDFPGDPSSSSSLAKAHGVQTSLLRASSPLMVPPTSPTRHLHHDLRSKSTPGALSSDTNATKDRTSNDINQSNKRPRQPHSTSSTSLHSKTDANGHALKKARTLPALMNLPNPQPKSTSREPGTFLPIIGAASDMEPMLSSHPTMFPVTPQKQMVPTLTELLASSKKGKGPPSRRALGKHRLLVSSQDNNAADLPVKSKSLPFPSPPRHFAVAAPVIDPYADDADFEAIIAANAVPHSSYNDPYKNQFDPYTYDVPVDADVSPTKSLSSLAGSDSEDVDGDESRGPDFAQVVFGGLSPDFVFKPAATSTQRGPVEVDNTGVERQDSWASVYGAATSSNNKNNIETNSRPPPSSGSLYPAYNSQFEADVARKVDTVSQLLERDVDYAGWLRDPSPVPKPGMAIDDSP